MKLSIIVPIYNERSTIDRVLDRLAALDIDREIIVVDDGSTDGTRDILAKRGSRGDLNGAPLRVLLHPV